MKIEEKRIGKYHPIILLETLRKPVKNKSEYRQKSSLNIS
jgi:hypothetical protein